MKYPLVINFKTFQLDISPDYFQNDNITYNQWQIMAKEGNVKHCPIVKDTWEARALEIDCGGLNSYHCLTDNEGKKWERCVEKALINEGNSYNM